MALLALQHLAHLPRPFLAQGKDALEFHQRRPPINTSLRTVLPQSGRVGNLWEGIEFLFYTGPE